MFSIRTMGWIDMQCSHCGTHNIDTAELCRLCGRPTRVAPASKGTAKVCPFCKTDNDRDAPFCKNCMKPLGGATAKEPTEEKTPQKQHERTYAEYPASAARTAWAGVGGTLILIMTTLVVVDISLTIAIFWEITTSAEYDRLLQEYPEYEGVVANLMVCQSLRLGFVLIAIPGGFFAVKRLRWGLSMAGGILGILATVSGILFLVIPYWALIQAAALLAGIVGLVMVGFARKEFMLA
ncbi:MAG: zinc ribbon domain-containing protein [Thermoplasmata archaeon]